MSNDPSEEKARPQIQPDTPDDDGPPKDVETEDKLPRGQHSHAGDAGDD